MIGRAIRESWNDKRNVSLGKAVGLDYIHIGKLRIADRNINPEFDLLRITTAIDCCGTNFQWIATAENKIRLRSARKWQKQNATRRTLLRNQTVGGLKPNKTTTRKVAVQWW